MTVPQIRPMLFLFSIAVVIPMLGVSPALAQDGADQLRRLNEQLEAKVADLESALAAARGRIAELENQLASGQPSPPAGVAPPTTPPAVAGDKNPSQLEAAIRDAYTAALLNAEVSDANQEDFDNLGPTYQRWLKKWVAATDRVFRKPVSWTVLLNASQPTTSTESMVSLVAWDLETGQQIGKPFQTTVSTRTVDRVRRNMRRTGETEPLTLSGVYTPRLILNPERIDRGPFDNPPFIGAMVELRWLIDAKSLSPVKPEPKTEDSEG